jgi:hypothetical protein
MFRSLTIKAQDADHAFLAANEPEAPIWIRQGGSKPALVLFWLDRPLACASFDDGRLVSHGTDSIRILYRGRDER